MTDSKTSSKKKNGCDDENNERDLGWKRMLIDSTPPITDPRELETILLFSLRSLFGELEPHSSTLCVQPSSSSSSSREKWRLHVYCPVDSAPFVQAALTWATLPPYMEGTLYRIDMLVIKNVGPPP